MTKEELSSRRMTTLNPSDKSKCDLRTSGKRNQPHVKSVGSLLFVFLFVCLFVCLFVLQSCKGLEGIVLESAKGL